MNGEHTKPVESRTEEHVVPRYKGDYGWDRSCDIELVSGKGPHPEEHWVFVRAEDYDAEVNRLSLMLSTYETALAQISRMRCHPDKIILLTTLTAAIRIAGDALEPPEVKL